MLFYKRLYLFLYFIVQVQFVSKNVSIFLPSLSHTPPTTPHPLTHTPLFGFVHGSFIHVPWQPFPFLLKKDLKNLFYYGFRVKFYIFLK